MTHGLLEEGRTHSCLLSLLVGQSLMDSLTSVPGLVLDPRAACCPHGMQESPSHLAYQAHLCGCRLLRALQLLRLLLQARCPQLLAGCADADLQHLQVQMCVCVCVGGGGRSGRLEAC
jgi:hypothetical protein